MSWDDWGWYSRPPKRPPPAHGIRMRKAGATWWGQRWIEALERLSSGYSNRLKRGKTYARAGRTHDLAVAAGSVTAYVTGSRSTPYEVHFSLKVFPAAVWRKAIGAMAAKAQFAADLLAGQMPHEIDAAFQEHGASLFPAKGADLKTECSCPDWANPCKHVAATHYVLGEAFDRDPFLLFEVRGRTRAQVLDALRKARSGARESPTAGSRRKAAAQDGAETPSVRLAKLSDADYDKAPQPLPTLRLGFEAPVVHGVVLRPLGAPASWRLETSPADLLAPAIRAASEEARRIALAEEPDAPDDLDDSQATFRTGRDETSAPRSSRRKESSRKAVAGKSRPVR